MREYVFAGNGCPEATGQVRSLQTNKHSMTMAYAMHEKFTLQIERLSLRGKHECPAYNVTDMNALHREAK